MTTTTTKTKKQVIRPHYVRLAVGAPVCPATDTVITGNPASNGLMVTCPHCRRVVNVRDAVEV